MMVLSVGTAAYDAETGIKNPNKMDRTNLFFLFILNLTFLQSKISHEI